MAKGLLFVGCSLAFCLFPAQGGKILQISDFHYDANYDPTGDVKTLCHADKNGNTANVNLGQYGNYSCDAPLSLVSNAVAAAQSILAQPELILWTGDNVPHIDNYTDEYVINAINTTTSVLKNGFPTTTTQVLPVFGNHDYAPSNAFPDNGSSIYTHVFELWKEWIGDQARDTFLRGGYYKFTYKNVTFLVLNTNLYYRFNGAVMTDKEDPAQQFAFMEEVLGKAQSQQQIVHVVAHIAPGVFERTPNFTWMVPQYNKRFLDITVKYASTIGWMIFGHHHTDTFHLVKKGVSGKAVQLFLMCPAVTPWFSDLPGAGANNPSLRVIEYEDASWNYVDIKTYYVNLNELNTNPTTTKWQLEYSMKDAYKLSTISPTSMSALLDNFKSDDAVFKTYIDYNSVLWEPKMPQDQFRLAQLCSIEFADLDDYAQCMAGTSSADSLKTTAAVCVQLIFPLLFALFY
jgi:sphingomyelin phosphodiesterase acid-like 3